MNEEERALSALKMSEDAAWLRKRLNDAKSVLSVEYRTMFKNPRFDRKNKRLYGGNGYYLQWSVRPQPAQPISYDNQQTGIGTVQLHRIVNKEK